MQAKRQIFAKKSHLVGQQGGFWLWVIVGKGYGKRNFALRIMYNRSNAIPIHNTAALHL